VGPRLQKRIIAALRPHSADVTGYPAFFDHCTANAMERLFRQAGLVDVDSRVFYYGSDYFKFFVPGFVLITLFEKLCKWLDWTYFASGFVISARKPPTESG
jgi:hypothetical protein